MYTNDYGKHFGDNFRRLRKAKGVSIREMADQCGLTHTSILRYEHGALPCMLCALILADYFGVTLDELIRPNGQPTAV